METRNHNTSHFTSFIKSDTFRCYGKAGLFTTIKGFLVNRHFRAIVTLRMCQKSHKQAKLIRILLFPLARIIHKIATNQASMDLPWETNIGYGFTITHGWGLVITPHATIGNNVTVFHGVTIGRRDSISDDGTIKPGFPTIEDDVWIGPNAIIVGDITIGRGCKIAAGSFITQSMPANSLAVGNPSQIVNEHCRPDVPNKFIID